MSKKIGSFMDYMTIKRGCSRRTAVEYAADLWALKRLTGKSPHKSTTEDLDAFLTACAQRGCKAVTVRRKIASFRAFYKWTLKAKILDKDPSLDLESPKMPKRLPHVLSKADVQCIIDFVNPRKSKHDQLRDKAMMEVLYAAGVRREELTRMDVGHLNFEDRSFRVIGKGNKERVCYMNARCEAALRAYLAVRRRCNDDALFVGRRGKRLGVRQMWFIFKETLRWCGASPEAKKIATPHVMRHSFATHLYENGCDIMTIKELLGHENLNTTMIYCNISPRHKRKAYDQYHG